MSDSLVLKEEIKKLNKIETEAIDLIKGMAVLTYGVNKSGIIDEINNLDDELQSIFFSQLLGTISAIAEQQTEPAFKEFFMNVVTDQTIIEYYDEEQSAGMQRRNLPLTTGRPDPTRTALLLNRYSNSSNRSVVGAQPSTAQVDNVYQMLDIHIKKLEERKNKLDLALQDIPENSERAKIIISKIKLYDAQIAKFENEQNNTVLAAAQFTTQQLNSTRQLIEASTSEMIADLSVLRPIDVVECVIVSMSVGGALTATIMGCANMTDATIGKLVEFVPFLGGAGELIRAMNLGLLNFVKNYITGNISEEAKSNYPISVQLGFALCAVVFALYFTRKILRRQVIKDAAMGRITNNVARLEMAVADQRTLARADNIAFGAVQSVGRGVNTAANAAFGTAAAALAPQVYVANMAANALRPAAPEYQNPQPMIPQYQGFVDDDDLGGGKSRKRRQKNTKRRQKNTKRRRSKRTKRSRRTKKR